MHLLFTNFNKITRHIYLEPLNEVSLTLQSIEDMSDNMLTQLGFASWEELKNHVQTEASMSQASGSDGETTDQPEDQPNEEVAENSPEFQMESDSENM